MTIEIHKPELEALIQERMKTGAYESVEDALIQALRTAPIPTGPAVSANMTAPKRTGADLIAAMQASPCKEINLEPERSPMPSREVEF